MPGGITRVYSEEEKQNAVHAYFRTGSTRAAAAQCNIPKSTIDQWKRTDWWQAIFDTFKNKMQNKLVADFTKIISNATEQLIERVENGDEVILQKTGSTIRKKIPAKELSTIIKDVTASKLNIERPSSRTAKPNTTIKELQKQFEVRGEDSKAKEMRH